MDTKSIICPKCGSNDITIISNEWCKCNYCETAIKIEEKNNYITKNEIHIHQQANEKVEEKEIVNSFHYIKKNVSENEILRWSIIRIGREKDVPTDFFENLSFAPIMYSYGKYAVLTSKVDVEYSASIGYDREEKYYVTENYKEPEKEIITEKIYDEQKRRYITQKSERVVEVQKSRQVEKSRTITDWTPFSSKHSGNHSAAIKINSAVVDADDLLDWLPKQEILQYDAKCNLPCPDVPNEAQMEKGIELCKSAALGFCRYNLPGDRYNDFTGTAEGVLTSIDCYTIPQFQLYAKYKDEENAVQINSVATQDLLGRVSINIKNYNDPKENDEQEIAKKTKKWKVTTLIGLVISAISFCASVYSFFDLELFRCFGLFALAVFCAIVALCTYKNFKQKIKEAEEAIKLEKLSLKCNKINNLLTRFHLDKLTDEEINLIQK